MNIDNFKRVLDHIKAHPETWRQYVWHCGTVHCIAGHAQIISGKEENSYCAGNDAQSFLKITIEERRYLFSEDRTIADFDNILANGFPSHVSGAT